MPKSYADLLREARAQIREVTPQEVDALPGRRRHRRRRPRGVRVGAGPPARRPPHLQELHRAADRGRGRPIATPRSILYCAGGVRSLFAAQTLAEMGYTERRLDDGRLPGLEGRRARRSAGAGRPDRRAEAALQPPPAHPRGRHRRPGEAARLEGPARSARAASARRRRCTSPRPASGRSASSTSTSSTSATSSARSSTRPTGSASARSSRRARSINALNPEVKVVAHEEMLVAEQRRADHRRLRRDPRRHRHVRDALHPQRRGGRGRHPGRPRQRLPVRGPADDLHPVRGAVLPLPVPDPAAARARAGLLGGRRARRRARDHRPAPGQRGAQGPARDRRDARRPAAPVRCPRDRVHRAASSAATRTARSARTRPSRRARPAGR